MSLGGFVGAPYEGYSVPPINSSYLGDVAVSNLKCNNSYYCTNDTVPINSCNYVYVTCVRGNISLLVYTLLHMQQLVYDSSAITIAIAKARPL